MMMHHETYTLTVSCGNCDFSGDIQIEKGRQVIETFCPKCRCLTLTKNGTRNETDSKASNEKADEEENMSRNSEAGQPSPFSRSNSVSKKISGDLGLEDTLKNYDKKFGRIGVFRHRPF